MEFMSQEHIDAMNALLLVDDDVRAECAKLDRAYAIAYRCPDGPGGQTVHITMTFDETCQFALAEHPAPDFVMVTPWRDMVRSSAAGRRGEALVDLDITFEGDEGAYLATRAAFAAGRGAATLPITFPDV